MNETREQAFPSSERNDDGSHHYSHPGMSLRDYFAAKALNGLVSSPAMVDQVNDNTVKWTAEAAWRFADAMLTARTTAQPDPVKDQLLAACEAAHEFAAPLKATRKGVALCETLRSAIASAKGGGA